MRESWLEACAPLSITSTCSEADGPAMAKASIAIRLLILLTTILTAAACPAIAADQAPPLVLERTIPLKDVSGRIDHMAVDPGRRRLIVAELGNGTVDVIDLAAEAVVHRITGLRQPQGVAYVPPPIDLIFIASAGDGSVRMFRGDNFSRAGSVALGDDADNLRVDSQTGNVVAGYGSGGLAIIDPEKRAEVGTIKLPAHPESFRLNDKTGRAFVNVPDAGQIAVVDLRSQRQAGHWVVPGLRSNFPMALDDTGATVATVFRSPPRLVLLDAKSGAVTATLPTCGDADDVFFDERRRQLYVSCGAGAVDVLRRDGRTVRPLARIRTSAGARTSLFVPELDRLFVAERAGSLGSNAAIRVYRPAP
jgi:hypothetical protein